MNFKTKIVIKDKEGHYIISKGSIQQGVNTYAIWDNMDGPRGYHAI